MRGMKLRPRFSLRGLMISIAMLAILTCWIKFQRDWIVPRERAIVRAKEFYIGVDTMIPRVPWYSKLLGYKHSVVIFHVKPDWLWEPEYAELVSELKTLFPESIVSPPPITQAEWYASMRRRGYPVPISP